MAYAVAGLVGVIMTIVASPSDFPSWPDGPDRTGPRHEWRRTAGHPPQHDARRRVGTLVGKHVPAVIATMVWIFILEPLSGLIDHISKFAIGQTGTSIAGRQRRRSAALGGAACLVLLAWTATFLLAAALVDRRRDIA